MSKKIRRSKNPIPVDEEPNIRKKVDGDPYEVDKYPRLVLFLDNASVHHTKSVQNCLNSKVTLLFNAEYSPMLNPVEEFFSKLKMMMRKLPTSTKEQLLDTVQKSLTTFGSKDLKGYVRHMLSFVKDCMLKKDLL
jgi:transposase